MWGKPKKYTYFNQILSEKISPSPLNPIPALLKLLLAPFLQIFRTSSQDSKLYINPATKKEYKKKSIIKFQVLSAIEIKV